MKTSTVILSYNSEKTIGRCLDDLLESLSAIDGDHEVFIIENGSGDNSRTIVERYADKSPSVIKPTYLESNTGTTYSRNLALRKATGDFVLVLDSDAYVSADALQQMIRYLTEHPRVGIAAPRLFYGSGNFQMSCDVFPTLVRKAKRFVLLRRMEAMDEYLQVAAEPTNVDYAISACWMMRKEVVEAVGMLDERIFYSPEDVDYCIRVWEAGYSVTYLPDVHVTHDAQELSRGLRLSKYHFSHLGGLFYLFRKHRYFWGLRGLYRRLGRLES